MWEQINALYLRVRQIRTDASWAGRTHYVSRSIIEGVHLFQGITDATMGHGEGWQYLRAGRFLERAASTAMLLDAFLDDESLPAAIPPPLDQADWVALLRSCSALEGYCRHYTADVRPERVTEFLLLDAECPRSIRFAATRVEGALRALARHTGQAGRRPRGAAVGPAACVARLCAGGRDPCRGSARVPGRRQRPVRAHSLGLVPELHVVPDRVRTARVAAPCRADCRIHRNLHAIHRSPRDPIHV